MNKRAIKELKKAAKELSSLGGDLLIGLFLDQGVAAKVLSSLPVFVTTEKGLYIKPGIGVVGIPSIPCEDSTKRIAILVGGKLTPDEIKKILWLFNKFGKIVKI